MILAKLIRLCPVIMLLCASSSLIAQEGNASVDRSIILSGMTAFEMGQFVRGHHRQKEFEYRPWLNRFYGQLRVDAQIGERLKIIVTPEVKLWYDSYPITDMPDRSSFPFRMRSQVTLAQGEGILSYGDVDNPWGELAVGMLHFKYNPDAHNLGEYMFRTGVHPAYIMTSFDYAFARLPGMRFSTNFFKNRFSADALLTFEPDIHPIMDGSITILTGYRQPGFIDESSELCNIGAGISFDRAIPVSGEVITTPENSARNKYYTKSGEEKYYSFGGKKLMARLSLDPKGVLPQSFNSYFNQDDWKLFFEVAVLGTKNIERYNQVINGPDTTYEVDTASNYYNNRKERIPFMLGFNVPFPTIGKFRLWDLCSFQLEYYGWPYTNSFYDQGFGYENPIPKPPQSYPKRAYELDNWKFSLFMKKEIITGFTLIGQVARDHTRHDSFYESQRDEEEVFTKTDDITSIWHVFNPKKWGEYGWWLKLQYNF